MTERPIAFSAPMVCAILAGTKTQTRRVVRAHEWVRNPDDANDHETVHIERLPCTEPGVFITWNTEYPEEGGIHVRCPYGLPGDRLWVREAHQYADWTEDGYPWIRYRADNTTRLHERIPDAWGEKLSEIWAGLSAPDNYKIDNRAADRKWRPPMFMPRWASRITLEVTEVRVQRLQEISAEDARAEGVTLGEPLPGTVNGTPAEVVIFEPRRAYAVLWDAINGKRAPWASNPWVWAITFKKEARATTK